MEENILTVLADGAASFSKGQRRIAQYITANYEKAAFMTASRLGAMVGVSESTVVRFATELGYEGYPEMRRALQEMIKNSLTSVQRMEVSRDLIESKDILSAVLSADIEKIRRTLEEVDKESFEAAVDALVSAEHIYVLGLRSSSALAVFLGFYLNLIFPNVKVVSDSVSGELFEQILRVHKGDVFVGISFPAVFPPDDQGDGIREKSGRGRHLHHGRGDVSGGQTGDDSPVRQKQHGILCGLARRTAESD